jgi:hypothetical protein
VLAFGLFLVVFGIAALKNPLWLLALRSGRIASSLIVIGVMTLLVGFVAGIGRIPWSRLSLAFSLLPPGLLVSIGGLYDKYKTNVTSESAARVAGPGGVEVRVRNEPSDSDRCYRLELRSGRGVFAKSRDLTNCRRAAPVVASVGDTGAVSVTVAGQPPCDYRVDAKHMSLTPIDTAQCKPLPGGN